MVEIKITNKFVDDISEWIKKNSDMLEAKTRHGVSLTTNDIRDKVRMGLSATGLRINSPMPEGGTLMQGIVTFMHTKSNDNNTGVVSILGNRKVNDGTWRLRFFEGGTKRKKSGKEHIHPRWFFKNSISGVDVLLKSNIEGAIQKAIDELNK